MQNSQKGGIVQLVLVFICACNQGSLFKHTYTVIYKNVKFKTTLRTCSIHNIAQLRNKHIL